MLTQQHQRRAADPLVVATDRHPACYRRKGASRRCSAKTGFETWFIFPLAAGRRDRQTRPRRRPPDLYPLAAPTCSCWTRCAAPCPGARRRRCSSYSVLRTGSSATTSVTRASSRISRPGRRRGDLARTCRRSTTPTTIRSSTADFFLSLRSVPARTARDFVGAALLRRPRPRRQARTLPARFAHRRPPALSLRWRGSPTLTGKLPRQGRCRLIYIRYPPRPRCSTMADMASIRGKHRHGRVAMVNAGYDRTRPRRYLNDHNGPYPLPQDGPRRGGRRGGEIRHRALTCTRARPAYRGSTPHAAFETTKAAPKDGLCCVYVVSDYFAASTEILREFLHQLRNLQCGLAGTGTGSLVAFLHLCCCICCEYFVFGIDLCY